MGHRFSATVRAFLLGGALGGAAPGAAVDGAEPSVPRGERILGLAVAPSQRNDYAADIDAGRAAGMQALDVSLAWGDVEPSSGVYRTDPADAANALCRDGGIRLHLQLQSIDTVNDRRPSDLRSLPWDHPSVIARYLAFAEAVLDRLPKAELVALVVGNEVDGLLRSPEDWGRYTRFFRAVAGRLRARRPGVPVGVKGTWKGFLRTAPEELRVLSAEADAVMLSYYPLNDDFTVRGPDVVGPDVEAVLSRFPGRPVFLSETGYPTGRRCRATPEQQARYVRAVFRLWDRHASQIRLVSFFGLTDLPPRWIRDLRTYFGVSSPIFLDCLATIGLQTQTGAKKPGYRALAEEARARGWAAPSN